MTDRGARRAEARGRLLAFVLAYQHMADWLSNKRAIVTGAARGIGLAVAQSLGLLGAKVLMVDNG